MDELERDLQYAKESLQTTIEELETANEELKSTNEELQSTNEELQSANEELETSKEEMQSLNEELNTVNTELQAKVDELSQTANDMQNLLNSTQVATIFLDAELRVNRYTEPAKGLFNLIPSDVGRPLSHLTSNVQYEALIADCREVLRTLVPKEVEARGRDGSWYLVRTIPYRTVGNVIEGVVLTFVDVTRVEEAERQAVAVWEVFDEIAETARHPLVMLDAEARVVSANRAFCEACHTSPAQVVGRSLYEVDHRTWDLPPLRKLLDDAIQRDAAVADVEVSREGPQGLAPLRVSVHPLRRGLTPAKLVVLSFY